MATYSFTKEAKVYVVYGGNQYNIDISNIQFSQTFTENSYSVKSIHTQNYFEGSVINKANPASFNFIMPAIRNNDFTVVFNRLLDCETFDLYISTQQDTFKLETCVITNGNFLIERSKVLRLAITGEGSKLSRIGSNSYTIPGSAQVRNTIVYNRLSDTEVILAGTDIAPTGLISLSVELQNGVSWNPYTTVQGALASTDATDCMYPSSFTIDKKILGGSIGLYLLDTNNADLQEWDTNVTLRIKVGEDDNSLNFRGFDFNMQNCTFTNRLSTSAVYTQNYDWRLTQNPTNLSSIITYITQ
jgi:hypothetical protein